MDFSVKANPQTGVIAVVVSAGGHHYAAAFFCNDTRGPGMVGRWVCQSQMNEGAFNWYHGAVVCEAIRSAKQVIATYRNTHGLPVLPEVPR